MTSSVVQQIITQMGSAIGANSGLGGTLKFDFGDAGSVLVDGKSEPNAVSDGAGKPAEDHHHHLVCRQCGRSVEVSGPEVEAWAERVAAAAGYTEISHTLEVFGTCPACPR